MDSSNRIKRCKRCRKPVNDGPICQTCKSELLKYYEASKDWQMAYEIEKAQQLALRYSNYDPDDINSY